MNLGYMMPSALRGLKDYFLQSGTLGGIAGGPGATGAVSQRAAQMMQKAPQGLMGAMGAKPQGFLEKALSNPWTKLGLNLLEQGGPSATPHSVFQDIARAGKATQGDMDQDAVRAAQRQEMEQRARFQQNMEPYMEDFMRLVQQQIEDTKQKLKPKAPPQAQIGPF